MKNAGRLPWLASLKTYCQGQHGYSCSAPHHTLFKYKRTHPSSAQPDPPCLGLNLAWYVMPGGHDGLLNPNLLGIDWPVISYISLIHVIIIMIHSFRRQKKQRWTQKNVFAKTVLFSKCFPIFIKQAVAHYHY